MKTQGNAVPGGEQSQHHGQGKPVRGRFAPTPSGLLHIGNALTALLAWLQVRHAGGEFILRIEDLDKQRFDPSYIPALLEDLDWLGLNWDEGPGVGGPHGPYRQIHRLPHYQEAYDTLKSQGLLYPCFCSRKDRRFAATAPHGLASEGPIYDGTCRHLSAALREERAKSKAPAWRMIVPNKPVEFDDLVFGPQRLPEGTGGDFVVLRADGIFSYQLAVVVDDADMQITHVLRGDDLLDSTPRQVYLYRALGLTPPVFTHVPLVYTTDGSRLAKRDGSITLYSLRNAGVSSKQVVGYLAWLSGLMDEPDAISPTELVGSFDLSRLVRHEIRLPEDWQDTLSRLGRIGQQRTLASKRAVP